MRMKIQVMAAAMFMLASAWTSQGQIIEMGKENLNLIQGAEVGSKIKIKWKVLDKDASVILRVTDKTGKTIRTLDAGKMPQGEYSALFDGRDSEGTPLPQGEYMVQLIANPSVATDSSFGCNGVIGTVSKKIRFSNNRSLDVDMKGVEPSSVKLEVKGIKWDKEDDFSIAGNNFVVDAAKDKLMLNPSAEIKDGDELSVYMTRGFPLENPWALAVAPDDSLYICDNLYQIDVTNKAAAPRSGFVYKATASGQAVKSFGQNGAMTTTCRDVAVDADGNLYVVPAEHYVAVYDSNGAKKMNIAGFTANLKPDAPDIYKGGYWINSIAIDRKSKRIIIINGSIPSYVLYDMTKPGLEGFITYMGPNDGAQLSPVLWQYYGPCVSMVGNNFYQTTAHHELRKFSYAPASKEISAAWATPAGDGASAQKSMPPPSLWHAMGVAADGTGLIYVANRNNGRIEIFFDAGASCKYVATLGGKGDDESKCQMVAPHGLALSNDKKHLYVADDGYSFKHVKEDEVKGLARVAKMKICEAETLTANLTIKSK